MTETVKTQKQYNDLVDVIVKRVTTHLEEQTITMLTSADEELFELSDSADNNEEQARYFELMKQLRNIRSILSKNFIKNVTKCLKPYTQVEDDETESIIDFDELSLVGQQEMEDIVLIKTISEHTANVYREKLSHLQMRFEDLALKTPQIFVKDALIPANLCQAFSDALGIIFDLKSKKIFLRYFKLIH